MIWLLLMMFIPGGLTRKSIEPCGNSMVLITYRTPQQYNLDISLPSYTRDLTLEFDGIVSLIMIGPFSRGVVDAEDLDLTTPRDMFHIEFYLGKNPRLNVEVNNIEYNLTQSLKRLVRIKSIVADDERLCDNPPSHYFDEKLIFGGETVENSTRDTIDYSCGRRKVVHTELIVHGQPTQAGDWPWHVAISTIDGSNLKYLCGGTLLSKTSVLTAAHCATSRGSAFTPGSLGVSIGKHNLIGGDIALQERQVFEVKIHPRFNAITLNNDIAILKLKTEVVFNDFVQPACLWRSNNELPTEDVFGTVVGWGFNHLDVLSPTLQQITIPIVSELQCLKSHPVFFSQRMNTDKFCAGFANGTSACNGDSGGGLMVFVPDTPGDQNQASGTWYVRGIVSLTLRRPGANICDPDQYTIFTDVEKYRDWLSENSN